MRRLALFVIPVVCILAFVGGAGWWISSLGSAPDGTNLQFSPRVTDRNGRLLRAYTTSDGRWRLPARIADVDPRFFDVLFAYEDRRFREHHGVDAPALVRAALQFIGSGRIRSGGSTLTMQVARLLEPRSGRTLAAKFRQIVRAVELERMLTKDQILSLYLELAPYGGNIEGIRAASLAYFGKQPRRLTFGEAALLVALPQSPEARRPDRSVNAARVAKDRVLNRFAALSHVPIDEISAAKAEMVPTGRRPMPMLAAHAADRAIGEGSPNNEVRLTIDADLQKSLEELARERVRGLALTLGPDVSLAMLVVDNKDGAVVARVGSPDYFDTRRAGQLDLTRTLRSPGSTLKPFIYGLGFEDGFVHPETLIDDRP
ncbi:MAG: transglycosylase domain-containing protein, partial [Xanthobacteraceae bacterium]